MARCIESSLLSTSCDPLGLLTRHTEMRHTQLSNTYLSHDIHVSPIVDRLYIHNFIHMYLLVVLRL